MAQVSRFTGTNFLCKPSPYGFNIRFLVDEDKSVFADISFDKHKEGGFGIVHGGAVAAVLDEAMGTAAYEQGCAGYTVTMTYNYAAHIPLNEAVKVRAWVEKIEGKKVFTTCEARLANNTVAVSGTGIFIKSEKLMKMLNDHPYTSKDE